MSGKRIPVEIRFFSKVLKGESDDSCWIWTGSKLKNRGYGVLSYKQKGNYAHRISWIIHYGDIPSGLEVLHKCDVRACVNPKHLFIGTQRENMKDMQAKGRKFTKLSETDVINIRQMLKNGAKHKDIASIYNVTRTTITAISRGQNWAN